MLNPKDHPEHPGVLLRLMILNDKQLTIGAAANHLGVTRVQLSYVLNGICDITPSMCQRLAAVFGEDPEKWAMIQAKQSLKEAGEKITALKLKPYTPK